MTKMYTLKLTAAVAIAGALLRAGTKTEVDEALAKDLLRRGKAELVSGPADDQADADGEGAVDLSKLDHKQLVEAAKAAGIEGADNLSKRKLVEAIEKAAAAKADA